VVTFSSVMSTGWQLAPVANMRTCLLCQKHEKHLSAIFAEADVVSCESSSCLGTYEHFQFFVYLVIVAFTFIVSLCFVLRV
jgi:hypothetical protein